MPKHHASVAYVEPNDVHTFGKGVIPGNGFYDRAPNLEDYCISLDIEVELSSREDSVRENSTENTVIIMSYRSDGNEDRVNFMSGSKLNVAGVPNMLTTKYADMFVTDLVDYGTTEMLGIKSVDIEYNSACVPIITIKFTDVRGMSLFQPTELNNNKSYNGIRGFSKDNIAQSFFHAFFVLPLPKFTVSLKGFYGRPVSYEVMCDKFDAAFNSNTGDFDVTARFIGFAYSFMSDVSFDALLAAPYSDYVGEKYWQTNVNNGRFTLPDKTEQANVPMPKLYEIRKYFKTLMNESDKDLENTTITDEEKSHELEIAELNDIRKVFRSWYDSLYTLAAKKYGKDFVFAYGGETEDEDYTRIVILTNGKNIPDNDLSNEFLQYDDNFKRLNSDLFNKVENFNSSNESYRKLENVSTDFSKYVKVKTFNELWYNDNKKEIVFDGFHRDNILPREETIKVIFGGTDDLQKKRKRKIYDDGINQYIDAFVIEQDYSDIKRRINTLIEDSNKSFDEKEREKRIKAHNRYMFEKMGWYPSIENFTKIVMAHLETLMAMMFDVIDQTRTRTPQDLGITIGEDSECCDVNSSSKVVPPFPRITKLITDSDGITKREDAWAGDFKKGIGFKEVDMINGIFNAVTRIKQIEEQINATKEEQNRQVKQQTENECVMKYPLTSFDFFIKKNPYGTNTDISNDKYAFAGKVCMRMFDILAINYFRNQFKGDWLSLINDIATTEAENFYNLVRITNVNLMSEIGENGVINTGKKIIDIVTGQVSGKTPWNPTEEAGRVLFNEGNGFWLEGYRTSDKKTCIYPIQDMSYGKLEDTLAIFNGGKVYLTNNDIAVSSVPDYERIFGTIMKNKNAELFNTAYIGNYYKFVKSVLDNAAATSVESYKGIAAKLSEAVLLKPTNYKKTFNTKAGFISAFNGRLPETHRGGGPGVGRKVGKKGMPLYVGSSPDDEFYTCSNDALEGYFSLDLEGGVVNNGTITESFGFTKDKTTKKYTIDKDTSLFMLDDFYTLNGWTAGDYTFTNSEVQMAFFIMGLDCFEYSGGNIDNDRAFCNIPKLLALQIGVVLAAHASANGISKQFNEDAFSRIRKKVHVTDVFEKQMTHFLNTVSPFARMKFVKYFLAWSKANCGTVKKYLTIQYNSDNDLYKFGSPNCYAYTYIGDGVKRALFNQDAAVIKNLTNDLMLPVLFTRGNVNAEINESGSALSRDTFKLDKSQAEVYLDAFLKRLRELLKLGQPKDESNNTTTIAKEPSQTTDDMKIELYRYLKQIFDKWIPTTDRSEWKYETFFREDAMGSGTTSGTTTSTGHLFHFIDSYYNKVGKKLLINPLKLADKIGLSTSYSDVNVMMFNFLAEVYAEHRCMMKCVQNFRDLSNGMSDLFQAIPYLKMGTPKKHPDFVVIYTYAASKNLNVANSEFNDDGFMLNDEMETPLAIRSRGGSDDQSEETSMYYRIPAFGVSYGRQYQSYFKDINVNMSNPIMTQQAIIAKHAILGASRNEKSKVSSSQDLYDIYTNQSYTCSVEMMGCAWIQPLMYFVLLNVPMFRGSYLIMKVTHRLRPGDMTTSIVGCRMANVSNRLVENIFSDETDENEPKQVYDQDKKYLKADIDNDCPYKVFPVSENISDTVELTGTDKEKANQLMDKFMAKGYNKIAAAGIVGNIRHEVGEGFDHTKMPNGGGKDSDGYYAAGFCQWNDHYGNLTKLLTKTTSKYGQREKDGTIKRVAADWGIAKIKKTLSEYGADYQVNFIDATISQVTVNGKTTTKYSKEKLNSCTSPEDAAESFRAAYERGDNPSARKKYARTFYDNYSSSGTPPKKEETHDTKNFSQLFFNAVQKSAWSSPSTSVNLKPVYSDGGLIMFKQEDGKRNKLAGVFDIILNGYYDYIQNLNWMYVNSYSNTEEPYAISVAVSEKINVANRRIYVVKNSQQSTHNTPFGTTDKEKGQINEKLLRSIAKRYPDPVNSKILPKEVPQFSNIQDVFKDYEPANCNDLYGGGNGIDNVGTSSGVEPKRDNSGDLKIKDWNISESIRWFKSHSITNPPPYGNGKCATYVEDAIHAGGLPRMSCGGNGSATNLHYRGILKKNGFNLEHSGTCTKNSRNPNFSPQPGDISIIGWDVEKGEDGAFHACMYTGDGWWSDFNQGQKMSPYGNDWNSKKGKWNYPKSKGYTLPYFIYRYTGNKA